VVQIPRRCPGNCQEWCRYPVGALATVRSGAGALAIVRSGAENGLLSPRLRFSQDASLGNFLLEPAWPIKKATP